MLSGARLGGQPVSSRSVSTDLPPPPGEVDPMHPMPSTQDWGIAFGPVVSRRFGRSLGINNLPAKHCTYSCVYCQVGRTPCRSVERFACHPPQRVVDEVAGRVDACRRAGVAIDFLTFVPDGEPTLDLHLGRELAALGRLALPRGVLTNGSLLWDPQVRREVAAAERVSVKVDAGDATTWRRVDRPHGSLRFENVRDGALAFAREYSGELITETMLVAGVNDSDAALARTVERLEAIAPARCYLAVPTRPPADPGVRGPSRERLAAAVERFSARLAGVELLVAPEADEVAVVADPAEELFHVLAVHPLRERDAVRFLAARGEGPAVLARWATADLVRRVEHEGTIFLVRRAAPARPERDARIEEEVVHENPRSDR